VAHSYTPGLRVTPFATLRRERRLPLKGRVMVKVGDTVAPDTIVARTELPGNVQTVNIAAKLSVDPAKVAETLLQPIGTAVKKGQPIARGSSLFGLVKNTAESPADGTLESVSSITGQLILREPPIPVEVAAYVRGTVVEVLVDEGVVVETQGAFVQGIFGVGGETFGAIDVAAESPDHPLDPKLLGPQHRGKVVLGGAYVSYDALMKARDAGVAAVVVGGFDDNDLRQLLGKDLGVAITGSEDIGMTLVLTEGFGHIRMAERTWTLLSSHRNEVASVSGATQIRAGVMRPEILVPHAARTTERAEAVGASGLEVGSLLRVIRLPHFGRIGRVVELPPELRALESEAMVRVLVIEFADDGSRATVPRANVELIEG
jgi:hypothetical protein